MKLHKTEFQGVVVGIRVEAESDEERRVLWALRRIPAWVDETWGTRRPKYLYLAPELPWKNQTSVPPTPQDASV